MIYIKTFATPTTLAQLLGKTKTVGQKDTNVLAKNG